MNELVKLFNFEQREIRAVEKNGEPWFVAKDVCEVLGIEQPTRSVENSPEDEISKVSTTHLSSNGVEQNREMLVVNEPGLYRLIFQSRKPEAERFKSWVFHEVLPALRKTGSYHLPEEAYRSMCKAIEDKAANMKISPSVYNTDGLARFMGQWADHMLRQAERRCAKAEIEAHVMKMRLYDLGIKYGTTAEKRLEAHKLIMGAQERVEELVEKEETEWAKRKMRDD
jgi:prophage antirepressor-like protein